MSSKNSTSRSKDANLVIVGVKQTNRTYEVWQHFDSLEMSDGTERAQFKKCGLIMGASGNSHLLKHATRTSRVVKGEQVDPNQPNMTPDGGVFVYDNERVRERFCHFVIQQALLFNHFDNPQFTQIIQENMQPQYRPSKPIETEPKTLNQVELNLNSANCLSRLSVLSRPLYTPILFNRNHKTSLRMQSGEGALSVMGPRPMDLSTNHHTTPTTKQRTSSLLSPIMLLTGHQSAIYTLKFNPTGTIIASGSHDREIFLWNTTSDCKNFMVLKGHKNAILDLQWTTDGSQIISASPDKTLRAWDIETGKQTKKMAEHSSFVNSCCPSRRGPPLVVSGSDDGTAKLWDLRQRGAIQTFPDKYQITAVGFSDASDKIFTGGIDNDIKIWDLRKNEVSMSLQGHQNMITGMQLSPDGSYLLTNGMDGTLRIWDMRPYAPQNRCVKIMEGHQHNVEQNLLKCGWSPDGSKVTAGSSDRMVYVWDTTSRRILYKLPGHTGSVNECVFHPTESIIGSCSSDKQIYLGEI
ncbi:hypothetical protein LXL04_023302 [Taraxacum kok-saghyz]